MRINLYGATRTRFQDRASVSDKCLEMISLDGRVHLNIRHEKVNRTLEFIARNHRQPFHLPELVNISRMSRRGFLKAFQIHTGTTPGQLLRQIRIEQSKRLLIENDLHLTEIAAMSGFKRLNSFCVAFKREVGTSPKKFQRQAWLKTYQTHLQEQKKSAAKKTASLRESV